MITHRPMFAAVDSRERGEAAEAGIKAPQGSRTPAFMTYRPARRPQANLTSQQTNDRELAGLMEAAQAGDAKAYAQLLRKITPRLRGYFRRRWPSLTREDIEDLVQDVLLSVHAARATYASGEEAAGESYRDPEALREAVQHLPRKLRIAIEMLKLRELSLKEVSAATGMSINALKASIHRALPQLRRTLMAPDEMMTVS